MEKLRILLLGVGNFGVSWAQVVIPACADMCIFSAAVDQQATRLQHVPQGVACFTNLDTALQSVKPQLVIQSTPPHVHTALNIHLLSLGYPVLCEKPIADNAKDAEELLNYYQKQGGFLMIGDNYRYSAVFRQCRKIIASGQLGALHSVQCRFRHYHPDFSAFYHGKLEQPLLMDVAIHHLDVARYLTGEEPEKTRCETWDALYSWYQHRPASATIQTQMTGGIRFHYFGTLAAPASTTDWNGEWEIECERGVLQIRRNQLYLFDQPEDNPVPILLEEKEHESRVSMLREALLALREQRKSESDLMDNMRTFRWVLSAVQASQTHVEVQAQAD